MSKRKNRNKYRFQGQPTVYAAAAEQQSVLPLEAVASRESETSPVEIIVSEATIQPAEPSPMPADVLPEVPAHDPPQATAGAVGESLGQRLAAAREVRGLSCADAAAKLKLPLAVLQALEAEQFDRIGYGVYLRGYLSKYLQLLDLPQVLADRVVQQHASPPPLTTAVTKSRPRYLYERYSGAALYLILTAVIVVPAVMLATRGGLDKNLARIAPLDAPAAIPATHAPVAASNSRDNASESAPQLSTPSPVQIDEPPLIASMTPFPASAPAATQSSQPTLSHRLQLSLHETSWVEIVDANGQRLEYGLLPAGSVRDYSSNQALDVRLGNAEGATIVLDGKSLDLAGYRRANVAHLRIADGVASPLHGG